MSDFGEREGAGRSGTARSGTARWCGCGSGIVMPWGWVDPDGGGDCGCGHAGGSARDIVPQERDAKDLATARPIRLQLYGGDSPNSGMIHGTPLPEVSGAAGGLLGSAERDTVGVMAGQVVAAPTLGVRTSRDYPVVPPHIPVYPRRNANRAPRTTREMAVLIKVHRLNSRDTQDAHHQEWPNPEQAAAIMVAVNDLAKTNAYGLGGFDITFPITPFVEVTLDPSKYERGLRRLTDHEQLLEVIKLFEAKTHMAIAAFDHVITFSKGGPFAATAQYVNVPDRHRNNNPDPPADEIAAALMHEMGHTYSMGHSNTIPGVVGHCRPIGLKPKSVNYGDLFDYMGGVSQFSQRFWCRCTTGSPRLDFSKQVCSPGPSVCPEPSVSSKPPRVFAPASQIHTNPVRKLQHGWLSDDDIQVVRESAERLTITPLTAPSGVRALEVERGIDEDGHASSLMVYWRDNEPLARCGVSISIVRKQEIAGAVRTVNFELPTSFPPLPTSSPRCLPNSPFPVWKAILLSGESYCDPVSGAVVTCRDIVNGQAIVSVQFRRTSSAGGATRSNDGIPVFDVISPAFESREVIRKGEVITVAVDAAVPAGNPGRVPWWGITNVSVSLTSAEPDELAFVWQYRAVPPGKKEHPPVAEPHLGPTQVWRVRVDDIFYPGPGTPIGPTYSKDSISRRLISLHVDVKSDKGMASAVLRALIDQT